MVAAGCDGRMRCPIRLIILCNLGISSTALCQKVNEAAVQRGIHLEVTAVGTVEFKKNPKDADLVLLEPQVRHLKSELQQITRKQNIPLELADPIAFVTMDGEKVLNQVLQILKAGSGSERPVRSMKNKSTKE
ncbi:PTS sugar transporter subunit IIB [Paenactinomyces guangxiensis]|nr:PTS sugar transporter subunit IIB [Paenactinomyces guangxiensis]